MAVLVAPVEAAENARDIERLAGLFAEDADVATVGA
jgi:hypothetical protein